MIYSIGKLEAPSLCLYSLQIQYIFNLNSLHYYVYVICAKNTLNKSAKKINHGLGPTNIVAYMFRLVPFSNHFLQASHLIVK